MICPPLGKPNATLIRRSAPLLAVLATLAIAACGGGGDNQVFGSSASSSASTGSGMGGSGGHGGMSASSGGGMGGAGVCKPGDFRCTGDDLETCTVDGSGFKKVITCPIPGLCDAAGGQCDVCNPGTAKCADATTLTNCSPDGQSNSPTMCGGNEPFCMADPKGDHCAACLKDNDCGAPASDCELATCSADGTCGKTSVAKDTACGAPGQGGKCDGAGACVYCAPGDVKCDGLTPSTCDAKGQWQAGAACTDGTPICSQGACVACLADADCPVSANECLVSTCSAQHTCGYTPKAQGDVCANGAGTCDGAGQCDFCQPGSKVCNGDSLLVCGNSGQYDAPITCSGATSKCDPQNPKCVACYDASQCPQGANACLVATCAGNQCGFSNAPNGTACTSNGTPGTCNGSGLCFVCQPGSSLCNGNLLESCNAVGQYDATSCNGGTPYCNQSSPSCVQCLNAGQCPASGNPCLASACNGNACGFSPLPNGTACPGGTCNGAGQCNSCQPGSKVCNGNQVLSCNAMGQYDAPLTCAGNAPYCNPQSPSCVQCTSAAQCPASQSACLVATCTGNACGFANAANGTACTVGSDAGTCSAGICSVCQNGATRCNPGANNIPQLCVSGAWVDQAACGGGTPVCSSGVCTNKCSALLLNGTSDYVTAGPSSVFNYGSAFTTELWYKANAPAAGYQYLVTSGWGPNGSAFTLQRTAAGNLEWLRYVGGWQVYLSVSDPASSVWHHIAMVQKFGNVSLWIDGSLVGQAAAPSPGNVAVNKAFDWGGLGKELDPAAASPEYNVPGSFGPIRVSSVARYSAPFTPTWGWKNDANTNALWNLGEGVGSTTADSSGNGITATLKSPTWTNIVCPAALP